MAEAATVSFLDRTFRNLRERWRDIADSARGVITGQALRPDLPDEDRARLGDQMRACLEQRGGQVSARARAAELGRTYLSLNEDGRRRFLSLLANEFDVDHPAALVAARNYEKAGERPGARRPAERALKLALEPPRLRLLTQFNGLPEGIKFLVDLRSDLMRYAKDDPSLEPVAEDLKGLLAAWFDVGFLDLRQITWDSPASLLEKLSAYEAVHEMRDWSDLKNRLDADRRCFAFFHPRMPNEPLIFLEVALVSGLADNIQALLDVTAPVGDPRMADAAIFYSISNAQKGLGGISFGDFLIKRVVDLLSAEFPRLKTFATLSPVPGFAAWLDQVLAEGEAGPLAPAERKALAGALGGGNKVTLKKLLSTSDWVGDSAVARALRAPLLRLCARYLLQAKRENGRAVDPVAHFHLSNGARIERLDWLADTSPKGLRQSAGIMVNYLYRQADIEGNHEAYAGEGIIAAASSVTGLV